MNLSDNIKIAFEVVSKTYESVNKFIKYCDSTSVENGYEPVINKILKDSSNSGYEISLTKRIVKLYQQKRDDKLNNGWRNGPIFAIEIDFYDKPVIYVSKLEYEDIAEWRRGVSLTEYWGFSDPIESENSGFIKNPTPEIEGYFVSVPGTQELKKEYWDIKEVIYKEIDLLEIDSSNVYKKIFGEFDVLRSINI
jgi:hypothetical protein